jgi:biopolymer transport protein ExbD
MRAAEPPLRPDACRSSAEMNVTPLIDILLVMLIIFMTALDLSQEGLDVNLPVVEKEESSKPDPSHVLLVYTADREITINTEPVPLAALEARLRDVFATRRNKTLFVRGDGALRYGEIEEVLSSEL